ncbi:MAG TPA: hypothetical protein PK489_14470, partial [Prolixibacteraceae bacterium]|nr:hypothetical protein [Prolixibacteraceae bacterium]
PFVFDAYAVTTNGMEVQYAWDFNYTGTFSADSHDRFPTTTFLPDPAEFADTPTVDRQIALVVSAELEGVVYSDTLVQTVHLRKPVYVLFSTIPSLGPRNEV